MSDGPRPTLLCYDGSAGAGQAIEAAARLLGPRPARLVHVWEPSLTPRLRRPLPGSFAAAGDVVAELERIDREIAEETLARGAEAARAAGFDDVVAELRTAGEHVGERSPTTVWRAIVDAADELDAAVIVVGSSGLSGVGSALVGSVSQGVLHHAARPVLVVRPGAG